MKKILSAVGVVALACSTTAFAASAGNVDMQGNWYAGIHGGAAIIGGPLHSDFNTGFDLGAQFGYYFYNNFHLEGAYTYIKNNVKDEGFNVEMSTVMANGIYDFHLGSRFVPYIGVGAGWAHFSSNISSDTDNEFAYQGIAGLGYKISKTVTLGLEYRALAWTNNSSSFQNLINLVVNYRF